MGVRVTLLLLLLLLLLLCDGGDSVNLEVKVISTNVTWFIMRSLQTVCKVNIKFEEPSVCPYFSSPNVLKRFL
jgi:hypothetical protein